MAMMKTWTAALLAVGTVALLLLALLWSSDGFDKPNVERYETQPETLVFDFSTDQDQTQTTSVDLRLGPTELHGLDKAEVFVKQKETQLVRYPGTASGSLRCTTLILINGIEFYRTLMTYDLAAFKQWSGSQEDVKEPYVDLTYPDTLEQGVATKFFHPSGENHLHAAVTCTSNVATTGPMWVVIDFAPLYAIITS